MSKSTPYATSEQEKENLQLSSSIHKAGPMSSRKRPFSEVEYSTEDWDENKSSSGEYSSEDWDEEDEESFTDQFSGDESSQEEPGPERKIGHKTGCKSSENHMPKRIYAADDGISNMIRNFHPLHSQESAAASQGFADELPEPDAARLSGVAPGDYEHPQEDSIENLEQVLSRFSLECDSSLLKPLAIRLVGSVANQGQD